MTTILCFCHVRWNFVYQRPQHLLTRCSKNYIIYFIEEPLFTHEEDGLSIVQAQENLIIVTPNLKINGNGDYNIRQQYLLDFLVKDIINSPYICWYYSPMALQFSNHLLPILTIYDCMDELSAFMFAPAALKEWETNLINKADIVFTGGHSLYHAKKHLHKNVYAFPSSIEKEHFAMARKITNDPPDQDLPYPRLGFFGVIDERFDVELIRTVAEIQPDWHFVFIGPVVKIDADLLPKAANIHYLGKKSYGELPAYISGWQIALIPFAINESTRFISPTKTPEYLAAGKPVISTAITDVVHPYGDENLVSIVHSAGEFITAAKAEFAKEDREEWLTRTDAFLANNSWDNTWKEMNALITTTLAGKQSIRTKPGNNKKNAEVYV